VLLPDQFLQTLADHHGDRIVLEPVEYLQLMPGTSTPLVLHLTSTRSSAAFRLKVEGQGDAPLARLDVFNFWLSGKGKAATYA
jgi:hypothetical protein